MVLRRALASIATRAPVRVFPIPGWGGRPLLRQLQAEPAVVVCQTPRSATVAVVLGRLPRALLAPAMRIHDQMPGPRAVVRWTFGFPDDADAGVAFEDATVTGGDDIAGALCGVQRDLLAGRRRSSERILLDLDPAPWRGVGPYGTGGKGMTGGIPFGRPLAERGPDRDGLELDVLPVRIGPLWPSLPAGLTLDVQFHGDIVAAAAVGDNPYTCYPGDLPVPAAAPDPFQLVAEEPVLMADLELARARHHLYAVADTLRVIGLSALSARASSVASRLHSDGPQKAARLVHRLCRLPALRSALGGIGRLTPEDAGQLAGPVARAVGVARDLRAHEPAYRALGFAPITHADGDALARLRQRLAETAQALDLAASASTSIGPVDVVEGPRGPVRPGQQPMSAVLLALLPDLVAGTEWGDAVATVASLDIDVEEAASAPTALARS